MNFFNQLLNHRLNPFLVSLGAVLVFSLSSSLLSAATIDDLQFTLINGETEYSVSAVDPETIAGTLDIPATYNGKPVTEIPDLGFSSPYGSSNFPDITSVTIPASIQTIGANAFQNCRSLSTVTFAPDSQLTSLGAHSFFYCHMLTSIVLPESVTSIGNDAFSLCALLTSIVIPDSVTSIGSSAFFYCSSLTSIELPASLTSIGSDAFRNCLELASVTFLGAAPSLGDTVFTQVGILVGGFTITIFDTHEASYDSWRSLYAFDVVPGPVMLAVTTSYTPSNQGLSIITHNEDSAATLTLEHTSNLGDGASWTALSTSEYQKYTDAATGVVTRTLTLDPATNPSGFYRFISADSPNSN
jgi:hypothetical protein